MIMIFHIFILIFSARLKPIFIQEIFFYCFLLLFSATIFSIIRSIEHIAKNEEVKLQFLKGRSKGKTVRAISRRFK